MMCLRWIVLITLGLLSAGISTANDCEEVARSASGPMIGLNAAGPSVTVDVACHFTSATSSETFTVSSTNTVTVAASLSGTLLTLDPGHVGNTTPGTASVTVARGSESYAIDVVVSSCLTAADAALLPRLIVNQDQVMTWDLDMSNHFVKTSGLQADSVAARTETSLTGAYPNPFNPVTTIEFALEKRGPVNVSVYYILGRSIAVLVDSEMNAGTHSVAFDASHLPSGLYIIRMEASRQHWIQWVSLVK